MTPDSLRSALEEFLGGSRHAVVLEDGARIYDLADSKYSISGEFNKCLLHLWSAERNTVRRVLDAEVRNGNLRLMVQRLGQTRPSKIEICGNTEHRTPTARKAARTVYQQHLRRALERNFPGFTVTKLSNAVDLERSVRTDLRPGMAAPRPHSLRRARRQSAGDPGVHRCGPDFWHSLAGRVPQFGRPPYLGGRP